MSGNEKIISPANIGALRISDERVSTVRYVRLFCDICDQEMMYYSSTSQGDDTIHNYACPVCMQESHSHEMFPRTEYDIITSPTTGITILP